MKFKDLRKASGMNMTDFAKYFNIPYRTIQNWEAGTRQCPEYVVELIEYRLQNEGFLKNEWVKLAFMDLANEMEKECGNWHELPDTEKDKKIRERIMTEVRKIEESGEKT